MGEVFLFALEPLRLLFVLGLLEDERTSDRAVAM